MKRQMLIAACAALAVGPIGAAAQTDESKALATQAAQMDSLATSQGGVKVSGRISSDFLDFSGSPTNADGLVGGLRNGTAITLSSTNADGVITSTTTFTPPTGKMGYGNVYTSLALAKQQLAELGITQPTALEIEAALMGGTVIGANGQPTKLTGVLTLRAQGMGWGQIAQNLGYKLGPVISGMKSANAHVSTPASTASSASRAPGSGVTTAAGSSHGQGNAYGRGITTGAGGAGGQGQGNAYGRGITTGAGGPPGHSGAASQGKGGGKGN
jgi:hypothetical protein